MIKVQKQSKETGLWETVSTLRRNVEKFKVKKKFLWFEWDEESFETEKEASLRNRARLTAEECQRTNSIVRIIKVCVYSDEYGQSWRSNEEILWKNGEWL